MTYTIYGAPGSGSGIVEAACAELGVDYEPRDLDARNGEHLGRAYAAVNPHRKMPTLQTEDGEIITESVAIILTLDERHPEAGLLPPPGSKERAQALRWMLFLGMGWSIAGGLFMRTVFARSTAKAIGWQTNGFQCEIGFASLGIGPGGIYASFTDTPEAWIAASIAGGIFLLLSGLNHIIEIFREKNYAP
mgnify:CR=1 FL=1